MNEATVGHQVRTASGNRHKTAMWLDGVRAIRSGWKRYVSILVIAALGITMFLGLTALSEDLGESSDRFYDQQGLYDLSVTAPGGLTKDDIDHLRGVQGIERGAGIVEQTLYTTVSDSRKSLTVSTLNSKGINQPYLVRGFLPERDDQMAVNQLYLKDSAKHIGDTVHLSQMVTQGQSARSGLLFKDKEYTITAVVDDPKDVNSPDFSTGSASTQAAYTFFVSPDAALNKDSYTTAYLTVSGARPMDTFAAEYKDLVAQTRNRVNRTARPSTPAAHDQDSRSTSGKDEDSPWMITDRSSLQSYNQIENEVSLLKTFGTAFPMLFLLIAVLISLTTITRMVEEDRQLIGTYKALGYRRNEILIKYLLYSGSSSLLGALLGVALGVVALPLAGFKLLRRLYLLPQYYLTFNWAQVLTGLALFVGFIVGTAWISCMRELKLRPAVLMRPEAPKAGKSIMLEKIGFIWGHLSFLNKVTARNLFRYKARALMSIFGVLGCTALMMVGFTVRDTMSSLPVEQYDDIYAYDVMAVNTPVGHEEAERRLSADSNVSGIKNVGVQTVTVAAKHQDDDDKDLAGQTMQLIIVPDGQSLKGYIALQDVDRDNASMSLPDSGAVLTVNAAKLLGIKAGSAASVEDAQYNSHGIRIESVATNYTGNCLYMSQKAYQAAFDSEDFQPNAMLIKLKGSDQTKIDFADDLQKDEAYISVVSNQQLRRDFSTNYATVNEVVGLLIVMAALLAFAVLFTLSTTNISERERELATIKVLGFRRREVHSYVNKETMALTLLGIVLGLPTGLGLTYLVLGMMRMPGIYAVVHTSWTSWAIVAILAMVFAYLVMLVTNRSLDRIDMVSSLKSPE